MFRIIAVSEHPWYSVSHSNFLTEGVDQTPIKTIIKTQQHSLLFCDIKFFVPICQLGNFSSTLIFLFNFSDTSSFSYLLLDLVIFLLTPLFCTILLKMCKLNTKIFQKSLCTSSMLINIRLDCSLSINILPQDCQNIDQLDMSIDKKKKKKHARDMLTMCPHWLHNMLIDRHVSNSVYTRALHNYLYGGWVPGMPSQVCIPMNNGIIPGTRS